jgi:predicted component of type VI protein secretion system
MHLDLYKNINRGTKMVTQSELRKETYRYLLDILGKLPANIANENWIQVIPLEEFRSLKEGVADPSPALVALLKDLLKGVINEETIDLHLVTPFKKYASE